MEYEDYISLQKEKTLDPVRREIWLGREWDLKLNGFKRIFGKIKPLGDNCLCIGARTGQEVQALIDMGKNAIGIDLIPHEPLVKEGDFHNLDFESSSFDFIFSNSVDHVLYPDKFFSEITRVSKQDATVLLHLEVNRAGGDKYGVFKITNLNKDVLKFLPNAEIISYGNVWNEEFANINKELIISIKK